jgi:hypothetical protein
MSSARKRPFAVLASRRRVKTFNLRHNALFEARALARETGKNVVITKNGEFMQQVEVKATDAAYHRGVEAVRQKPTYAPRNPYDEETQKAEYDAWDNGADDAGMIQLYNNGELIERFRR